MTNELALPSHLPPAFGGTAPTTIAELRSVVQQAKQAWLSKTESEKPRIAYGNDLDQFLTFHHVKVDHVEAMTRFVPDDVTRSRRSSLRFFSQRLDQKS